MKQLLTDSQDFSVNRIKYLLLTVILLVNSLYADAQNSSSQNINPIISTQETIFLHSNTTSFLSGETLYYKLYCLNPLNNTPSLISKIGYVEIIDHEKKSVQKNKIYLEKGIGTGEYFIPTNLKTGTYKLIAYTKWMLNNPKSQIHETDIFIINPFESQESGENITFDLTAKSTVKTAETALPSSVNEEKRIELTLDKESYNTREKVDIKIKSLTDVIEKGNYSISIRKTDQIPVPKQLTPHEFAKKTTDNYSYYEPVNFIYIPELRSELITGTIISRSNLPINNKSISLSLPGKEYVLKIVKTNAQGKFSFLLDQFPNFPNAIFQVLDDKSDDYTINFDAFPTFNAEGLQFTSKLNLSPNLKKDIEERSTASQIQNAYYQIKKDSLVTEAVMTPFFSTIEKTYVLDNYTRFPTLKENIVEVIKELYYRRENNKYQLRVRNDHKDLEMYGPPLILVDGLLIQEPDDLFEYNMANIDKVSLITEPYVYGPNLYGGLISFESKNSDFANNYAKKYLKTVEIQRPNPQKIYNNPDYSFGNSLHRIPDYRYQLLWKPNVTFDKKLTILSFYTSDIKGNFEVILEGFTKNGLPIYVSKTFIVQ